ncbi:hypothetical protein PG993_008781 [Apiospora rasikravindrae]|uniref:Uncharacterized protein n=1 Tax=Apiospora rasikravindrae TaxID=990691 RepID=A0ABR1SPB4_9PEZI
MATSEEINPSENVDELGHFLGVLEFNDRISYFEDSNLRGGARQQQVVVESRLRVLNKVIKELKRAKEIRDLIGKERNESHLVKRLVESRSAWEKSDEYQAGIKGGLVNSWSKRGKHNTNPDVEELVQVRTRLQTAIQGRPTPNPGVTPPERSSERSSGRSSGRSRELPRWIRRRSSATRLSQAQNSQTHLPTMNENEATETTEINYDADEDFNAYLIQYKKSDNNVEPSQVESLKSTSFPDQRLPIRQLLGEIKVERPNESDRTGTVDHAKKADLFPAHNLLKGLDHANKIRYFHFPANNMVVSK